MDFGPDGMVEMLAVLNREKLPYFGGGHTIKQAVAPFLIEIKGHKIAIFGFNEFYAMDYAATETGAGNSPLSEQGVIDAVPMCSE